MNTGACTTQKYFRYLEPANRCLPLFSGQPRKNGDAFNLLNKHRAPISGMHFDPRDNGARKPVNCDIL